MQLVHPLCVNLRVESKPISDLNADLLVILVSKLTTVRLRHPLVRSVNHFAPPSTDSETTVGTADTPTDGTAFAIFSSASRKLTYSPMTLVTVPSL